jgi:tetratricopeptide (TPR) repeat protein
MFWFTPRAHNSMIRRPQQKPRSQSQILTVPSLLLGGILVLANCLGHATLGQARPLPLIEQAQLAQTAGNHAKAEALWRQVLKQQPNSALAYYNLGLSQHRQVNITDAMVSYQNAIRLDPNYSFAHLNLGFAYLETGKFDQAIPALQRVLALPNQASTPASTHTLAYYNLAIIYNRQGNPADARQALQKALALTPNFTPAQTFQKQLQ